MARLIATTSPGFELPFVIERDGNVLRLPAGHLPQLSNPDGSPHFIGDLFLQHLHTTGVSNHEGSGTLRTDADLLAPFINWCYHNRRDILSFANNDFEQFILHLKAEKSATSPTGLKRQSNQVARIGAMALRLMQYVDDYVFCERKLLSPAGPVKVIWKAKVSFDENGRESRSLYMTHAHLPPPTTTRRRRLISDDAVLRMLVANKNRTCTPFLKQRSATLIWILDITGGRIDEVANIQVPAILAALTNGYLILKTVKRKEGPTPRKVPVSQAELQQVLGYIKMFRPRTVNGKWEVGALFTDDCGKQVKKQTLSKDISTLRQLAGIVNEEVVAHSFRHRFLTRKLAEVYAAHGCRTSAELRQLILADDKIREELMEWSGHKSIESFNRYIHLEFGKNGRFGVDVPAVARLQGAKTAMAAGFNEVMAYAQDGDEEGALARYDQMRVVVSAAARGIGKRSSE